MQILMSDAAHARICDRLAGMGEDLDVVTMAPDGGLKRAGEPLAVTDIDPEVFWVSQDLYRSGQLPAFFGHLLRGSRGQWVQTFTAGLDNPVFARIMGKGLRLTKSSAQAPAIAEYVVCHALSLLHPIKAFQRAQSDHAWKPVNFREIASTRWLMVGFGAIGTEIARRLQPFGASLTVVRRSVAPEPLASAVRPTSDLHSLLPNADVVVLAAADKHRTRRPGR